MADTNLTLSIPTYAGLALQEILDRIDNGGVVRLRITIEQSHKPLEGILDILDNTRMPDGYALVVDLDTLPKHTLGKLVITDVEASSNGGAYNSILSKH